MFIVVRESVLGFNVDGSGRTLVGRFGPSGLRSEHALSVLQSGAEVKGHAGKVPGKKA